MRKALICLLILIVTGICIVWICIAVLDVSKKEKAQLETIYQKNIGVPKSSLPDYDSYTTVDISSDKKFKTVIWSGTMLCIITEKRLKSDTAKHTYYMENYFKENKPENENIYFTFIER